MREKIRTKLLLCLDIVLINISVALAYLLRFDGNFVNIPTRFIEDMLHIFVAATIIKIMCFLFFKLYDSLWRYASIFELMSIVFASLVSNAITLSYIFIARLSVPRSIFIISFLTDIFLIGGARFSYRVFRRLVRGEVIHIKDSKRILIVGGTDAGALIIKEMKVRPELKSVPVAIVDEDIRKKGRKINGVSIVGSISDIPEIIKTQAIDEVIIAISSQDKRVVNEIYNYCFSKSCKVRILPSVSELIDESVVIQRIRDVNIEDLLGREPVNTDMDEISSYLKNQVVLVTGGGGSIGSELCRQIAAFEPKRLIILDNYENNAYEIQNEMLSRYPSVDIVTIIANIREKHRMDAIFKKYYPQVVFHAAAHKHVPLMETNPSEAIKNNVIGTLNVAESADKYKAKRFVLISTDKAVNPTNIMGATKRVAEMIIQAMSKHSSTDFVAVRFGNVLGSNGSVVPLFKKQIEQGGPVTVTHPEVTRFFMTIQEAVALVIQAGAMAKGSEIFVLDMGKPVKIFDLATNLIKLSGFEPGVDIKIEFTGLRPGEKLYEELLLDEEGLMATKNNKIFIAQPVFTDLELLKMEIERLKEIVLNNQGEVLEYMHLIVPEYRTQKL